MSHSIKEPSGWQIMKVLEIATQHLGTAVPEVDPDGPDVASDAEILLEKLKGVGANIGGIMEALLLAGDEAKNDVAAIKARIAQLRVREERRGKANNRCRNAAMAIMAEFPELFPPPARSKALAAFRSSLVDARVQHGHEGVTFIDRDKLMLDPRFVIRSLNEQAVRTAVLEDGEVIDGAELKNGAPFLVVKTS
jgi:hypothetical protein